MGCYSHRTGGGDVCQKKGRNSTYSVGQAMGGNDNDVKGEIAFVLYNGGTWD